MRTDVLFVVLFGAVSVHCQIDLAQHFQHCKMGTAIFDDCLRDAMNELRPFFREGIPDYGIGSFDPFHAAEVPQKVNNPFFSYKLSLRNVSEHGWSSSQVTKLKTDFYKNQMQVTQFFPDKRLNGWYDFEGSILGQKVRNSGSWNLSLFDYVQTLTVSRKSSTRQNPVKVKCSIQSCKKLELHIGNLVGGRTILENTLDWIINTAWQPGFLVLSPLINDLVGTAFSKIFDDYFHNFPFEQALWIDVMSSFVIRLIHEFKFFVFVLVKIKILVLFGSLWTIALIIGKVFAIIKASEYMKKDHHHEKIVYSAPPEYHDHSSFGSPYDHVGSPSSANGYAPGGFADRRKNIPEYRKYNNFGIFENLQSFVRKMNTTETAFKEMGITSVDCKRKIICELQYVAKQSSILSSALNMLRDSSFEKYRITENIPDMNFCASMNMSCKEDVT
nr:unnamed protein product [Callosobruchus chinensis]